MRGGMSDGVNIGEGRLACGRLPRLFVHFIASFAFAVLHFSNWANVATLGKLVQRLGPKILTWGSGLGGGARRWKGGGRKVAGGVGGRQAEGDG
jgi:hypothetical protein